MNIGLLSRLPTAAIVSATCIATQVLAADFSSAAKTYTVHLRSSASAAILKSKAANVQTNFEGAGFVVDKERGWLLTNGRIFDNGIGKVEIAFPSHEFVGAKVKYVDPELDFSVLVVKPDDLPPLATTPDLACDNTAGPGANVVAFSHKLGSPLLPRMGKVTQTAIVSGQDRIQTDIAAITVDSGGPLISPINGMVVGLIATHEARTGEDASAVPIAPVCKAIDLLRQGLHPAPRMLPFSFADDPNNHEALVIEIIDFSALKFGLCNEDRIIEANGLIVNTPTEVETALRGSQGPAIFKVQRDNEILTLTVPIGINAIVPRPPSHLFEGAVIYDAPSPMLGCLLDNMLD